METNYSSQGNKTLENLDSAKKFTQWLYSHIRPHLSGTILEIGSGTGTYSKKIINDFPESSIYLSEIDESYKKLLKEKFSGTSTTIIGLDIEKGIGELTQESLDSVFALNVFEHIKDHEVAFKNVYSLLKPGGVFVILVPAHMSLYNRIDASIGHFRRYSKPMLKNSSLSAGFHIQKIYFFNFFSIFGWWLNGKILRKSTLDGKLLRIFDRLVPFFRFVERYLLRGRVGISLIAVLRKPKN